MSQAYSAIAENSGDGPYVHVVSFVNGNVVGYSFPIPQMAESNLKKSTVLTSMVEDAKKKVY